MDEAVQCDYIAFIAYGKKLIDAPSADIPERVGLVTWRIEGKGLQPIYDELLNAEGVDQIARFGSALHVSGRDADALERTVCAYRGREGISVDLAKTGLEEAFIWLMAGSQDNFT